jgi:aspartyl-tRNA(Asn)/glutamyl-tRNA(Gln) amidotransferase subunit B
MVASKTISGKIAKDLADIVWREGGDPTALVEARGLRQVTDESAIEAAVDAVIAANPERCEEVKAKPKAAAWFVGQVMKSTGGKANPQTVNAILRRRLGLPEEG